ncbi:MAG: MBL fold metallo-hydrolase [Bacillota bacterium]
MKLNKINDSVYYIDSAVNMGLIVNDRGGALLVDTGIDESSARKVNRLIESAGFKLKGIIITHAHADHCGGAPYLVKATGAKVYAPEAEKPVLEFPLLEPVYLFSGAYPPSPLRNKFFLAPGVKVDEVVTPGICNVAGCTVEIVDLAGHALGQVGVAAGGVLFCADAVIGPEVIEKHGIPLNADLSGALESFDRLEFRTESLFVPAHGSPAVDISPVVAPNRSRVCETLEYILELKEKPVTAEEILAKTCGKYGINISNPGQQCLMNLTIMAYISYLLDKNQLTAVYENNRQFFVRAG